MRKSAIVRSLAGAATGLVAMAAFMGASLGAASAQGLFNEPFFGGGYTPAPSYSYGGYGSSWRQGAGVGGGVAIGGVGAGVGVGAVGYDQGYYYGGYQYPAAGYGGGDYRRAAYSNADVYVGPRPAYARPCYPPPRPVYRPYGAVNYGPAGAGGYYGPTGGGGYYRQAAYRPYGGPPPRHCRCETLY